MIKVTDVETNDNEIKHETDYEQIVKQEVEEYLNNVIGNIEKDEMCISNKVLGNVDVEEKESFKTQPTKFICNICSKICKEKKILYLHKIRVHSNPVPCTICGKSLKNKKHMNEHKKVVHDGIRHWCNNCGKGLTAARKLKNHKKICGNLKRFKGTIPCQICNKTFSTGLTLLNHQSKKHIVSSNIDILQITKQWGGKIDKDLDCVICWKTFQNEKYLEKHMNLQHKNETRKKQVDTAKSFINYKEDIHTGQKIFQCTICKTSYETNSLLQRHYKRVHIERKYSCTLCRDMFKLNNSLQNHIAKIHKNAS